MQAETMDHLEGRTAKADFGTSREVRKLKQGDLTSVTATGLLRGCCYQGCCGGDPDRELER